MIRPKLIIGSTAGWAEYADWLEAERDKLRAAAQAWVEANDNLIEAHTNLKAALDRKIVYQTEDEIPVDRAGRKMYNKFGDKLDIGERS
jgi:hypothetical protein